MAPCCDPGRLDPPEVLVGAPGGHAAWFLRQTGRRPSWLSGQRTVPGGRSRPGGTTCTARPVRSSRSLGPVLAPIGSDAGAADGPRPRWPGNRDGRRRSRPHTPAPPDPPRRWGGVFRQCPPGPAAAAPSPRPRPPPRGPGPRAQGHGEPAPARRRGPRLRMLDGAGDRPDRRRARCQGRTDQASGPSSPQRAMSISPGSRAGPVVASTGPVLGQETRASCPDGGRAWQLGARRRPGPICARSRDERHAVDGRRIPHITGIARDPDRSRDRRARPPGAGGVLLSALDEARRRPTDLPGRSARSNGGPAVDGPAAATRIGAARRRVIPTRRAAAASRCPTG